MQTAEDIRSVNDIPADTPPVMRVQLELALSKEWQKVRRVRQQLAERFNKPWNPNRPIPKTEAWIYITAWEDGESDIDGTPRIALRTFECECEIAAQAIAKNTHRLASKQEVVAFLEDRQRREILCQKENDRTNPMLASQRYSLEATKALTEAATAMRGNVANANPEVPERQRPLREQKEK